MNNSNREKILDLIAHEQSDKNSMQAHLSRMNNNNSSSGPKDYLALVEAHMNDNPGVSKAQAMRAITAKFPEKHEAWIRSVNKR